KMEQIGYVVSEDLPPITVFYNGVLKHPFRLYYDDVYNIVVSICEVPFLQGSYLDLARTLMDWALKIGIEDVVTVQGMSAKSLVQERPAPVFAAAEKEILNKILTHDVQRPPRGLIMGAEAAILNECLNNRLNGAVYLTPANPQIPAPEGAAVILEKISEVYNFPIKLDYLQSQNKEIKKKLLEIQKKTNKIHAKGPVGSFNQLYA
ncbi:MAG: proteasome assembly chaperone family protein, partial [Promethearchaeota archaeon]